MPNARLQARLDEIERELKRRLSVDAAVIRQPIDLVTARAEAAWAFGEIEKAYATLTTEN